MNPYGETKLTIERMLASYSTAYGLGYAALRYFNASGADLSAGLGERHEPESHLIPLVLEAALGRGGLKLTVFGTDHPTPDGTCLRDYVHVRDLAEAHLAALEYLGAGGQSGAFNLGNRPGPLGTHGDRDRGANHRAQDSRRIRTAPRWRSAGPRRLTASRQEPPRLDRASPEPGGDRERCVGMASARARARDRGSSGLSTGDRH